MQLPTQITIVNSCFFLDGGTVILHAITTDGAKCEIQLNQRVFAEFYANPGRLYFNQELVEVRSADESRIVQLLKDATVKATVREPTPTDNPPISKNALILGDDIREVLESTPEENLRRFRDQIVAFVESDEYVQIATHGLPK
jgi:hypothetical protein